MTRTKIKGIILILFYTITTTLYGLNHNSYSFSTQTHRAAPSSTETSTIQLAAVNLSPVPQHGILTLSGPADFLTVEPEILSGAPLAYPNPFRMTQGTTIAYFLSKPLTIEFFVYNVFGQQIYQTTYNANENGGNYGVNRIPFGLTETNRVELPVSAYFFVIMNDGKVLGKGKMGIIP